MSLEFKKCIIIAGCMSYSKLELVGFVLGCGITRWDYAEALVVTLGTWVLVLCSQTTKAKKRKKVSSLKVLSFEVAWGSHGVLGWRYLPNSQIPEQWLANDGYEDQIDPPFILASFTGTQPHSSVHTACLAAFTLKAVPRRCVAHGV